MADAGLKIVVGADISAVTDGMKVAANNVAQFGDNAEKAFSQVASKVGVAANAFEHAFDEIAAGNAALAKINASIDAAGDAAQQAGAKFDTLGGRLPLQDFNNFKKSVDQLKRDISSGFKISVSGGSLIPPVPPAVIESFNKTKVGANQAGLALSNVGRVAQDLPFGFIGIQNNLNPLLESFQRLKAETGSSKEALKALGGSLIGAGGIGLALSVVSSAFLIFQNGIQGFGKKAKEAKEAADDLAKSIRSISSIQGEATAGVEGQLAQVNALAAAVANSNIPYAQRKRALEELKDINKAYFGDLKLEDAATGALTKTVDEYTKALINNAIQKGFVDEIAAVAKEVSKSDEEIRKSRNKVGQAEAELTKKQEDAAKRQLEANKRGAIAQAASTDPEVVRATKNLTEANEGLAKSNEKVTALLVQEALLRDQLNRAVLEGTKFKDLDTEKTKKEGDGLAKQLSLLEKIRDAAKERQGQLFDLKDIDAATDKLAKLEQQVGNLKLQIALRDAKKAKLPASDIDALQDAIKKDTEKRLNEAFEKEALLLEFRTLKFSQVNRLDFNEIASKVFTSKEKITLTLGENGIDVKVKKESVDITDLKDRVSKATGLDKKIPIKTQFEIDVQFLGLKGAQFKKAKEEIELKLSETIAQVQFNGKVDIAAQIGDALGESLATGDFGEGFKKAAKGILSIIGDVMQQIGRQVITAALAIKALKATLEKFAISNPALAVLAGVGLVAAGAALKNIKFDGPKFAEGGIATGPVIGQIGERFRPEVILPLDRLPQLFKQFGGDVGGGMQLIPIINNEGLYLAMKRGERSAGRKF